jgi:succinyl-CoA synthetase beta subunit
VANAVGLAISGKMSEARFNTAEHRIFDHKVVCLAGDGCLQEGVASEACSLAGHLQLDNLILIYDSNNVTLDAMALFTQSEDTIGRFKAYGWDVQEVDGQNMEEFLRAYEKAKTATGKPQFIVAKTLFGKGIPEVAGTSKAHGEGGVKFADFARQGLGLPEDKFYVSPEVRAYFEGHAKELEAAEWDLAYIALDGTIGCMVNGAGLAMATMDIIKLYGEEPANFCDVGGGAGKEKVAAAFKIIMKDPNVKGILVNIFGGIMKCDVIAEGVIAAVKETNLSVPLVVRLEGTNVELGKQIIRESGLNVISADDLDDAAQKIVKAVRG